MFMLIPWRKVIPLFISFAMLGFLIRFDFTRVIHHSDGSITAVFVSFLPLKTDGNYHRLSAISSDPRQTLNVSRSSDHIFKIAVSIREQNQPKGNPIFLRLEKIPTFIPGVTKTFTATLLPRIKPEVLKRPPDRSGTQAPLPISFNTPLKAEKIGEFIATDFKASLIPQEIQTPSGTFTDYSTWIITPLQPLKHNSLYRITLRPGIKSLNGRILLKSQVFQFVTVPELIIVSKSPQAESTGVPLLTRIKLTANRTFSSGQVSIEGYSGIGNIRNNTLNFIPDRLLMPDTRYRATAVITDEYGESAATAWNFQTVKLRERIWIEVNLRIPQTVTVYQGKQVLRSMRASGGTKQKPTPLGTFRVYARGYAFYSYKYREGAYYFLRFHGPFLFHSVPFGPDYRIKTSEISKLGQPASHGCVRLSVEDAKWLYQHIPNQTPVIIHGSPEPPASRSTSDYLEDALFFENEASFNTFKKNSWAIQETGR